MARKTKYDPRTFPQLAEGYARDGLNDEQIAAKLGLGMSTYYSMQNRFPEFREAIKKGKEPVDVQVENALLKRALGYEYEETHTEVTVRQTSAGNDAVPTSMKKVKKHIPPDVAAMALWLTNRRPDKWKHTRVLDAKIVVDEEKKRVASLFPTEDEIAETLNEEKGSNHE